MNVHDQFSPANIAAGLPSTGQKRAFWDNAEAYASRRDAWVGKNVGYYEDDLRYMRFLVREGARVLDLGCGTGRLLAALKPAFGVGVDFSPAMVEKARSRNSNLTFVVGDIEDPACLAGLPGPFDFIVLSDTIGMLDDIEEALKGLHHLCHADTRIILSYISSYWEPALKLATKIGWRMPQPEMNHLTTSDFVNILRLSDFEPIRMEWRQLVPARLLGLGRLINRFVAPLPLVRNFCLRTYVVARSCRVPATADMSTTILIPCRNEEGNIERAIREMPPLRRASGDRVRRRELKRWDLRGVPPDPAGLRG